MTLVLFSKDRVRDLSVNEEINFLKYNVRNGITVGWVTRICK